MAEVKKEEKKEEKPPFRIEFPTIDIFGPLKWLGEQIVNALGKFRDWITEGLASFWQKFIPAKEVLPGEIYKSLTTTSPDWALPLVNELTHYYLDQQRLMIDSVIETNPYVDSKVMEDVKSAIRSIIIPTSATIITATIAAQLAELIHPLRELRTSETVKNILTAIGLYSLCNAVWDTVFRDLLIQPLKYDLNRLVRPWLPPSNIVDTMLFQEGIDEKTWEEYYRKIGWSEDWINAWRKARYKPPSIFMLYRVFEIPNIPESWYEKVLKYHGLDEEDRTILKEGIKFISLKDEIYTYRDKLKYYYKKGLISKDKFLAYMGELPLTAEVINLTVKTAELERDMELKEDLVNSIREGFKKGKLKEDEYKSMLKDLGIDDEVISSWLQLDKVKRKVELRKTVVSLMEVG